METWPFRYSDYWVRLDLVAAATARSAIAGASAGAATSLLGAVAVGAVNGPITTGLERHLGVLATLGAHHRVHLAFATAVATATTAVTAATVASSLASSAAVGAAPRGAEALGLVEFLFTFGERELLSAVDAGEVLI